MPQPIRIMHVLHAFSAGGLENGVVNIINRSPEHHIHHLCLLSHSGEFINRLTRAVDVHEMKKRSGNDMRIILKLRELFRERDVDIVHTRNWAAFDGVLAACLTRKPVLIHGEHGRDMSDPHGLVYRRNLTRRLVAFRAKKYVAVSRDLYSWLGQTVRIPQRKLMFIPNGVDTDRFSPGRDSNLRAELGIAQNEFVIGTVGRLDPIKNHLGLISAVQGLQRAGKPARLVIVGDGPLRSEIEAGLRAADLCPKALLLGYRAEIERFYRVFDAYVLNSFAEGMSNTLLEAMACGLPIVCTAVGGNVELIADGRSGALIPPGSNEALTQTLQRLLNLPSECRVYATMARDFIVENLSIKRMIEQYIMLYDSVARAA